MIIVKKIYKIRPDLAKKLVAISVVGAIKSMAIVGKFLPKSKDYFQFYNHKKLAKKLQ